MQREERQGRAHSGGDDRRRHLWPLSMMAVSSVPLSSGATVLSPGTEADGAAYAMIEAKKSTPRREVVGEQGETMAFFVMLRA